MLQVAPYKVSEQPRAGTDDQGGSRPAGGDYEPLQESHTAGPAEYTPVNIPVRSSKLLIPTP